MSRSEQISESELIQEIKSAFMADNMKLSDSDAIRILIDLKNWAKLIIEVTQVQYAGSK